LEIVQIMGATSISAQITGRISTGTTPPPIGKIHSGYFDKGNRRPARKGREWQLPLTKYVIAEKGSYVLPQ